MKRIQIRHHSGKILFLEQTTGALYKKYRQEQGGRSLGVLNLNMGLQLGLYQLV